MRNARIVYRTVIQSTDVVIKLFNTSTLDQDQVAFEKEAEMVKYETFSFTL